MTESFEDLQATYGPSAPFSEHKRGEHIHYTSAEGKPGAGTIVWCCAAGMVGNKHLGVRYVVAPDVPMGFVDIVWPGDVRVDPHETQEETLSHCPYCQGMHPSHLIESCPLKSR